MFNNNLFVKRLQKLLIKRNLSQRQLAKNIGYTEGAICKYISKERIPPEKVIMKMAFFLNVNPKYLTGETNIMKPPQDLK